jgi:hypothetical protein
VAVAVVRKDSRAAAVLSIEQAPVGSYRASQKCLIA